jgi:hypothetical protein
VGRDHKSSEVHCGAKGERRTMRKGLYVATALFGLIGAGQAQTAQQSTNPCQTAGTVASSGWSVSGGQLYLHGKQFIARGVAVWIEDLPKFVRNSQGEPLTTQLPGINFVRITVWDMSGASVARLQPYIATLTALGIVVEVGDTNYPKTLTGADLAKAENWYSMMATATKGNELVVYVTQNEPNNGNPAVNPMVRGIYNAVRSTGNNTLIIICPDNPFGNAALQESTVADMKNVAMTLHFYNWVTGYSTDLGANKAELAKEVANLQAYHSADGTVPVLVEEYGDATDGSKVDPGWKAVITAVHNSGLGTVAWDYWNSGTMADSVTNGRGGRTAYGDMVAEHIAAGRPAASSCSSERP